MPLIRVFGRSLNFASGERSDLEPAAGMVERTIEDMVSTAGGILPDDRTDLLLACAVNLACDLIAARRAGRRAGPVADRESALAWFRAHPGEHPTAVCLAGIGGDWTRVRKLMGELEKSGSISCRKSGRTTKLWGLTASS